MNINLIPNGAIKRVHVSQNDVGRTLTFALFNDSLAYAVPSGAVVKIQGTKPSGFGFSETCTVNGNVATIDTTEAMTDESGNIQTELSIQYDDVVIGTSNFVLAVERNPHPSNTTDGTQITAQSLQVQINQLAEIIESGGSGLTDGAKQALLNCFAHVAWIDEHGQDYYDALEDALYPPANLVSISCVYTQSGTVYDTDSLDSLKSDLVVTAHYDNGTTQTVTSYTLSGTLTVGTSTITVSYSGFTTTFNVTVTHADTSLYNWDFTQSLTDSKQGVTLTLPATITQDSNGLTFTNSTTPLQIVTMPLSTMGQFTIEIDVKSFATGGSGNYCLAWLSTSATQLRGVMYRIASSCWAFRDETNTYYDVTNLTDKTMFDGKTLKLQCDYSLSNTWKLYVDDNLLAEQSISPTSSNLIIGLRGYNAVYTAYRVYEGLV